MLWVIVIALVVGLLVVLSTKRGLEVSKDDLQPPKD